MQSVKDLIDKASKVCGSDSKLAERMGVHRVVIAEMKAGKRAISPATAAELADIAGEDARQACIDAVIESAKGTRREGALREILGKALAAGVAGMLLFSYKGDSTSIMDQSKVIAKNHLTINDSIHRIYCIVRSWFRCVIQRELGDSASADRALAYG